VRPPLSEIQKRSQLGKLRKITDKPRLFQNLAGVAAFSRKPDYFPRIWCIAVKQKAHATKPLGIPASAGPAALAKACRQRSGFRQKAGCFSLGLGQMRRSADTPLRRAAATLAAVKQKPPVPPVTLYKNSHFSPGGLPVNRHKVVV